jgi:hypothetical protein
VEGNAELIRRVGAELYGDRWIARLGAAFAIDPRTVRRWAAGQRQPPAAILQMPQGLVRERIVQLEQLAAELERDPA